jgi:carboxylesterase type B
VNFYGGAFIEGGGSFSIPPAGYPVLNASSSNDIVFVEPNYRVNAFGFLPGKEIEESPTSDFNPGLLDQQEVLKWTNKYISHFGGDPKNVSIWGQSAGGGSVVAQVIANGGKTKPQLFTKALASSPFWPKTYKYDAPQAQWIYDELALLTNCTGPQSLACLKAIDAGVLTLAALQISASHTYNTSSYTWAPVIDGSFISQPLSEATLKGDVNIDFGFGMYNTHEGENFIPPGLQDATNAGSPPFNSSTGSFYSWLRGYLPEFSDRQLKMIETVYPASGSSEMISEYNTTYERAQLIYRDSVLACPTFWMAQAAHKRSYVGEYSIPPAKHASDTIYVRSRSTPPWFTFQFVEKRLTSIDVRAVEPGQSDSEIRSVDLRGIYWRLCELLPDRRPQCAQVDEQE